ncbi:alpha-ketoglutarate-dependent dioxygenase AlkB [Psychrosphaera sp.]|nr:alpha-ketoglutarate-dependent dioxygenase AlkB [Psychrosphaera sp.]
MQSDLFNELNATTTVTTAEIPDLVKPWLEYKSDFLQEFEASELYQKLEQQLDWQQPEIVVFSKRHPIPRLQCWQSDPGVQYQYSGKALNANAWHPLLANIRDRIHTQQGVYFNSVLVNFYRNGEDKMGWHSDDEPELGPNPIVASLSLGASRTMHFKDRKTNQTAAVELTTGALLLMKAGMQRAFKHQVPSRKRVREGRISLTFRYIVR